MALDIETIGYFLYMEEQEREQEQDKDYSFRCNNEDNKDNEVSIWQE